MLFLAKEHNPQMIIAGFSAFSGIVDWKIFREIADEVGAYLLVDMAHVSGLVAAGLYPSPVPYADVVTSTTHKTLRGPRGGMILWNNPDYTRRINSSIFPGTQGGPLMNIIAAKAQCYTEALLPKTVPVVVTQSYNISSSINVLRLIVLFRQANRSTPASAIGSSISPPSTRTV